MQIGILAFQGAVGPHEERLQALGVGVKRVLRKEDLLSIDGIILPGGESTAMIHLLKANGTWDALGDFVKRKPAWGVCAGAILLANQVGHPEQDSLQAIDIAVDRNGFGRQVDSFEALLQAEPGWGNSEVNGVFIRAPRIRRVGENVKVLLKWQEEPVMVEENQVLAATFHPELETSSVHVYFIEKVKRGLSRG